MNGLSGRARAATVAVVVIGVGLALAPVAFRMFDRAPAGGRMLDDFRPYMNEETISDFRGYLDRVDAARAETGDAVLPAARASGVEAPPPVTRWHEQWKAIDAEMGDMLDDIDASLGDFEAVDALPPFALFPWFFLLPGLVVAGLGVVALRSARPRRALGALAVTGVALVAAPAVFQMFSRAPDGAEMIDTFRPLMTQEKVTRIQGHFTTIGAAEGQLRTRLLPALDDARADLPPLPGIDDFVGVWPRMAAEMAPMIGAMNDNLDAFAGIDALPRFSLFPWFFVVPGVLVAGLALAARRTSAAARGLLTISLALALLATACGGDGDGGAPGGGTELEGLLRVRAGECAAEGVTSGSWFRMVQPDGTVEKGPFVENGDSPCGDLTWTPFERGTDGGLRVGEHQPHPDPAFDDAGNALGAAIVKPEAWFAVRFGVATNPLDPQSDEDAPAPTLSSDERGRLSGDLSAFAAAWNGQHFNQGAPKPGGKRPGKTTGPTGTYDAESGAMVLEWTSQIVGGPFNNFTGVWHLEGTFKPA